MEIAWFVKDTPERWVTCFNSDGWLSTETLDRGFVNHHPMMWLNAITVKCLNYQSKDAELMSCIWFSQGISRTSICSWILSSSLALMLSFISDREVEVGNLELWSGGTHQGKSVFVTTPMKEWTEAGEGNEVFKVKMGKYEPQYLLLKSPAQML